MRGLNETIEHLKKVVERNRGFHKNCPAELDTRDHLTAERWADEMEDIVGWLEELVRLKRAGVSYICNGEMCENCYSDCKHTTHIEFAKNFRLIYANSRLGIRQYEEICYENEKEDDAEKCNDNWIPCSERLPEEYTEVLGCDYEGNRYVVELYKDNVFGNIWKQWNGENLKLNVIIAWQPLPKYEPKGE